MNKLNFHISGYKSSYGTPEQLPEITLPEVAFAGRSNVGKSSLLNKLMFSKKLAKVSSKPGKTATINFYQVGKEVDGDGGASDDAAASNMTGDGGVSSGWDGGGSSAMSDSASDAAGARATTDTEPKEIGPIHLVDLPGYGYAQVSKAEKERWSNLIGGYFDDDRDFALVVSLIDIRHDPSALDQSMVAFLQENGFPFAIALTKADKMSKQKAAQQRKKIKKALNLSDDVPMIVTSAENGTGMDELRSLIAQACG